jgi:hypothetical protein
MKDVEVDMGCGHLMLKRTLKPARWWALTGLRQNLLQTGLDLLQHTHSTQHSTHTHALQSSMPPAAETYSHSLSNRTGAALCTPLTDVPLLCKLLCHTVFEPAGIYLHW